MIRHVPRACVWYSKDRNAKGLQASVICKQCAKLTKATTVCRKGSLSAREEVVHR